MKNLIQKIKRIQVGKLLISTMTGILVILLMLYPYHLINSKFGAVTSLEKIGDWSSYSTFLSGIFSPIIQVLNIIVLIVIAIKVNDWNKDQSEKAINKQNELFKNELKFSAYKEFNNFSSNMFSEANIIDDFTGLRISSYDNKLNSIVNQYIKLFPKLREELVNTNYQLTNNIQSNILNLSNAYTTFNNNRKINNDLVNSLHYITQCINDFNNNFFDLLTIIEKDINFL